MNSYFSTNLVYIMIDVEKKIDEFRDYYHNNYDFYNSALKVFLELLNLHYLFESVSGRIKDIDECVSKFKRKYLPNLENQGIDYEIKDFITDIIGIRIVCLYLIDIDTIRKDLKKDFNELEFTDKTEQIERTDDKFGYRSLHLELTLNNKNANLPEYKQYEELKFELQIRTIIQDAWSVLDHKIKYKRSIPHNLKRRINRLSALFEVADEEFFRISEEIRTEEHKARNRIEKYAKVREDKPIDVFSFLFIARKHFRDYNFIEYKADGFVEEILNLNKNFSENDFNNSIKKHLNKVKKISGNEMKHMNPYTMIRHCLYLSNPEKFNSILYDYQKSSLKIKTKKK